MYHEFRTIIQSQIFVFLPYQKPAMPTTLTYSPLPPQTYAECLRTNTCRYVRYAETPTSSVPDGDSATHCVHYSSFCIHHSSLSYTFSAKERDSETGLSYFGSRYYSSDLSIWLSVDPMSDKYASLSPYTYCADNPVKLVDPNGEEIGDYFDKWKYNKTTGELSWYSSTGGKYHQIVVETENTSTGERVSRTVEFDGAIGRMFDFSVVSKKWDGIINGVLDVYAGGQTAMAGAMIMSEGSVVTSGAAFPIGATIFGAGSYQTVNGLMTIANAIAGRGVDMYEQQDIVRDICKSAGNSIASLLSISKTPKRKDIVKSIGRSMGSFIFSATWARLVRHATTHPTCNKVLPTGAIVH